MADPAAPPVTNTGAKWWAWCVAAGVLAADLGSKAWASHHVSDGPGSAALGGLVRLRRVSNQGATFGLGSQHPFVVTALAILGTAGVAWWLTRTMTAGERIAVGVVLGGALGNLLDRVAQGAVTDWLQVAWYPATFNLADLCIRGGIIAAVALRFLHSHPPSRRPWWRRSLNTPRARGGQPQPRRSRVFGRPGR